MAEILDKCPKCDYDDLVYEERVFEGGEAWVEVYCQNKNCGYSWNEVYKFSHNEDKDTGEII